MFTTVDAYRWYRVYFSRSLPLGPDDGPYARITRGITPHKSCHKPTTDNAHRNARRSRYTYAPASTHTRPRTHELRTTSQTPSHLAVSSSRANHHPYSPTRFPTRPTPRMHSHAPEAHLGAHLTLSAGSASVFLSSSRLLSVRRPTRPHSSPRWRQLSAAARFTLVHVIEPSVDELLRGNGWN